MEAALRGVGGAAELLAVAAHSDAVEQWDEVTLTRAFQWARYCEHLHSRFHNNPTIRRMMETRLRLTNQTLQTTFPAHTEISFRELSRCQRLLLAGLLNNPDLPSSILKVLFDTESPVGTKQTPAGLCGHIVQYRSACRVLSPLTDPAACGADAEVQGAMLMEALGALLSRPSQATGAERLLESVLQGCEERFCRVIAAALLTTKNCTAASQDFLLDWLQRNHRKLQQVCSALPSGLLADLAKEHVTFRKAYRAVLKGWVSEMEYSVSDGEWIQTSAEQTPSFQRVSQHFLSLLEACPSLRDDVEEELKALKAFDGGFDVRGLSVWGDLLSSLKK